VAQVKEQLGVTLALDELDLNEQETFKLFCEGKTTGIFQFESSGMRDILRRLQPSRFEDLIALNALYRPGPIQGGMIDDFIGRRHGKVKTEYEVPELDEILKETYGVIVYQEQVMQIASKLAGFSLGEADLLRRAMGKKKKQVMQAQRKQFLSGCKERGIAARKAERIFKLMEQFAGYGFNKSHSTAYALLAYQTAYLKTHYPVQFIAALLTSEMSNTDKIVKHLAECKEVGILLSCRPQGNDFASFSEFCENVDLRVVNRRALESLIKAGAFDSLGYHRKSLFEFLDRAVESGQKAQRDRLSGQKKLFMAPESSPDGNPIEDIPDVGEWPDRQKWTYEKETLGYYVTGHPLHKYSRELGKFSKFSTLDITEEISGQEVSVGGMITGLRQLRTRKGDSMAAFQLEDLSGTVQVLVWPNAYKQHRQLIENDSPVLVRGRCEQDARGEIRLLCSQLFQLDTLWNQAVQRTRIRISLPSLDSEKVSQLHELVSHNQGTCPLEFELLQRKEYRIRVIPQEDLLINPVPSFIQEVEELFGENSVALYT
jgi:DNA polymerase-3 subunit alpha